jgi:hypothetical protein
MGEKKGATPVTIYCSVCNRPHPNKVRLSKIKQFTHIVCPDCDIKDIPKESYEIWCISLAAIAGWHGVNVTIPDQEALDGMERAKRIYEEAVKWLHRMN